MFFSNVLRDTSPIIRQVCECVCGTDVLAEVIYDWLILDVDLYRTILVGGPLQTQFNDLIVLAVFSLLCFLIVLVSKYLAILRIFQ